MDGEKEALNYVQKWVSPPSPPRSIWKEWGGSGETSGGDGLKQQFLLFLTVSMPKPI